MKRRSRKGLESGLNPDFEENIEPVGAAAGCEQRRVRYTAFAALVTSVSSHRTGVYLKERMPLWELIIREGCGTDDR